MSTRRISCAGLLLGVVCALAGPADGQDGQGIVMRALDEPVTITVTEAPIKQALEQLTAKTGLRLSLDEEALAYLPHGEQTRLSLTATRVPLREALGAMVAPMSLEWRVEADGVRIVPSPALERISRRPTFAELGILSKLAGQKLSPARPVEAQLQQACGIPELRIIWQGIAPEQQSQALVRADARLPATGQQYLDALAQENGWTWYVWGTEIIILPRQAQAERQLMRRTTLRYRNQPLLTILMDLASKADLKLSMNPGVLNYLSPQMRDNFTLLMSDSTVEQALQAITGATGLEFRTEPQAIRVGASPALLATTQLTTRPRQPFLLMMEMPLPSGDKVMVPVRADDLPPELTAEITKLVDARKAEAIRKLMAAYGLTGDIPRVAPAAPPAATPTAPLVPVIPPEPAPANGGGR